LDPTEAASLLAAHSHETIHDVLAGLPTEKALEIASYLSASTSQQASDTIELAHGVKGTVSELMVPAVGVLPPETTIAGALDYLVHAQPVTGITYIYVVDSSDQLLGVLAMRDLLLGRPGQTLVEIMTRDPFSFTPDTAMPEAVNAALNRRHRLYPVTDESGRLLGLVYGWRLFEYVATEISAQSGSMVGVDSEERVDTPILKAFRMRHPWLQVNLLTAFCAAFVVGIFENTIAQIVALAVFLPVLAGQSGNTGCQALAITLRGLTLGELGEHSVAKLLRKEVILGAMNGFCVGLIAAAAMWLYAGQTGAEQPVLLALVVLLVPLALRRFGADPAMASSIFLTTFTDILGMGLMLLLATSLVL
jgi:magnesium transporter